MIIFLLISYYSLNYWLALEWNNFSNANIFFIVIRTLLNCTETHRFFKKEKKKKEILRAHIRIFFNSHCRTIVYYNRYNDTFIKIRINSLKKREQHESANVINYCKKNSSDHDDSLWREPMKISYIKIIFYPIWLKLESIPSPRG